MTLEDLQRSFARACLDAKPSADDLRALGDRPQRWELYRAMVRGRFVETLGEALPRTRDAFGQRGLEAAASAWLERSPPTSRYVRELSVQFVTFLERAPDAVPREAPPWALDLARYEAAIMRAHIAHDPTLDDAVCDLDMGLPTALSPAQSFLRVAWSVHRGGEPAAGSWALAVYRARGTDAIDTMEFNPIAGDIYEAIGDPTRTLTDCVQSTLARYGSAAGQAFIESFAELLGDLMDRGIVLGSRGPAR